MTAVFDRASLSHDMAQGSARERALLNLDDFEALARSTLDPAVWDMYAGGSADEVTVHANRDAFRQIGLRPRVLTDVARCSTATTVLGTPIALPVLIAPTSLHRLAHPSGEVGMAEGAAETITTVSTLASMSVEAIAAAASGPLWFQLYCFRDEALTLALVRRAERLGYRAIVVTVDTQRIGNRERDRRHAFRLPPGISFVNLNPPGEERVTWENRGDRAILTWATIDWLRRATHLPIVLKGIMTGEDGALAVEHGVDGIIVSNHGGRQLDTTIPTITALPEVVAAVHGQCEVLVDGGIRRGTDIVKALALGARAVLIGRPALWGLTVGGAEGVRHVLDILRRELEVDLANCGYPTPASIPPQVVRQL